MYRESTSESITEGCQADEIKENPDIEMEVVKEEIKITITDDEKFSFTKILEMAMRRRMKIFADEVSIVGLSHLVKPSSYKVGPIIRKAVWTLLLLFGTGFMVFQMYDRISYYLSYPTVVKYRVAYNQSLRFPTVTICSESLASKKAVYSMGQETQHAPLIESVRWPPVLGIELPDSYKTINLPQFDLDWEFVYGYIGTKLKDMIIECSFGNVPCNLNETVKPLGSDAEYCLSFNPVSTNYITTQPGATYGLHLVLWVNQSDSFIIKTPGVGFKVLLHGQSELPATDELGFRVGTGISASVSFSLRNLSMLPAPYGDCIDTNNYTRCLAHCAGQFSMSTCGCQLSVFDVPGPACPLDQLYTCVPKAAQLFVTSGAYRKCGCALQCHQPTYPHSVSTSPLSENFLSYMTQRSQFKGRNLTMSKLTKELVFLDIFYSQLSYVNIQTTPAYDLLKLVCDIGGALGLVLGGTILTIVEFVQFLLQLLNEVIASARFAKIQRG